MELSPLDCTNVGFLLGKVLVTVQTLVCGPKATWLCREGVLIGKDRVGFTGPCGGSGTLGRPGHGVGIELGHIVPEVDPKKAAKEVEVDASPGWGLGTPASCFQRCKDLGGGSFPPESLRGDLVDLRPLEEKKGKCQEEGDRRQDDRALLWNSLKVMFLEWSCR